MNIEADRTRGFRPTSSGLVLCAFLLIGGTLLAFEHRAHILGALPLLLPLLVCVGLHVFMHRRHSDHRGHHHRGSGPHE